MDDGSRATGVGVSESVSGNGVSGKVSSGGVVHLAGVRVCFGDNVILDNLSLDVEQGQFVVIVGPSGCGKTTVLNLIMGFVGANAGVVTVLDQKPTEVRDRVGYMFARDVLLPWRTTLKNVEFGLELKGVGRNERRLLSIQCLESVGLVGQEKLLPHQLSQGMRQRVALARTWVTSPEVLLMDEPFAALDAQTRSGVQTEFIRLWQDSNATVVFVTHDLAEAIVMGDRIVVMRGGMILDDVAVGLKRPRRLDEIVDDEAYRRLLRRLSDRLRGSDGSEAVTEGMI